MASVSCYAVLRHSLTALADQDRLALLRAATALNSTSSIPDSFKCGLAEFPTA